MPLMTEVFDHKDLEGVSIKFDELWAKPEDYRKTGDMFKEIPEPMPTVIRHEGRIAKATAKEIVVAENVLDGDVHLIEIDLEHVKDATIKEYPDTSHMFSGERLYVVTKLGV